VHCRADLRILEIDEIKTVPRVSRSHAIIGRLIGTVSRAFLDHVLFWSACELERTFDEFPVQRDAALRLARYLKTSTQLWMRLQADWDLHEALQRERRKAS